MMVLNGNNQLIAFGPVEETDDRFYVDFSTIPNANKGLFAKRKLYKGDVLEITGVYIKRRDVTEACIEYTSRYRYKYKDFYIIPVGFAAMINFTSSRAEENITCLWSDRAYLEVLKDIEPDEEVFIYGGEGIDQAIKNQNEAEIISKEDKDYILKNFVKLSFLLE